MAQMTKAESPTQELAENPQKAKAVQLIRGMYIAAGEAKSVNNLEGETQRTLLAEGMGEMAVTLGVLTEEEVEALHADYWNSRETIPQDFPDRF